VAVVALESDLRATAEERAVALRRVVAIMCVFVKVVVVLNRKLRVLLVLHEAVGESLC